MFRAIVISAEPYRDQWILDNLSRKIDLDYCLCVGDQQIPNDKINYLDFNKIIFGGYDHYINWHEIPPLDENLIEKMSACESLLFRVMDDEFAFDPVRGFQQSRLPYLKHLRYWNWFLDEYKINLVINFAVPHLVYDHVIYELCKFKAIRFLCLMPTHICGMFSWIEDWEESAVNIYIKYQQLVQDSSELEIEFSKLTQAHYDRQIGNPKPTPTYMESSAYKDYIQTNLKKMYDIFEYTNDLNFIKNLESQVNQINRVLSFKQLLINLLLPRKPQPSDHKGSFWETVSAKLKEPDFWLRLLTLDVWLIRRLKNRWILGLRKEQEKLESQRREILLNLERLELFGFYNKKAVEPDLSSKYIYVALHFQPEATTMPLAGAFANQLLIVQLLAYCVPNDVLIYVKDHPSQDIRCRSIKFYQEIINIPNVRLIPRNYDTFTLTDHALAVATATGTVGWEALFKGKPVLMFGHYVYQYAPGVLQISTLEDCQKAIHKIIYENFKPDPHQLKLFLKALDETCFLLNLNFYYEGIVPMPVAQTMNNLTDSIGQYLAQFSSGSVDATNSSASILKSAPKS
ncbi:hypothetical protein GlitD10_1892 [Gloeomargarita lithophora Alchichica-D10]|uniref:Capsule polysaccharide biosynthesis protein n=1 Tax=Gloeomargarita lithophora Alchichica-D10 TaxID=1188229 RepID=A0A1J0AE50_9CYAN|nr:hypothetical protein GlitD10_1892 [Gloeomargarita lithophora Alchichica-D10]